MQAMTQQEGRGSMHTCLSKTLISRSMSSKRLSNELPKALLGAAQTRRLLRGTCADRRCVSPALLESI